MPPHHPPGTLAVSEALAASERLSGLLREWERARKCMQATHPVLGAGLAAMARPGPLREGVWTLLADNVAAATKIRQLQPRLLAAARQVEPALADVQVRVAMAGAPARRGGSA